LRAKGKNKREGNARGIVKGIVKAMPSKGKEIAISRSSKGKGNGNNIGEQRVLTMAMTCKGMKRAMAMACKGGQGQLQCYARRRASAATYNDSGKCNGKDMQVE